MQASRSRKHGARQSGRLTGLICFRNRTIEQNGYDEEVKDAFFPGAAAGDWWQSTLEFVQLNWDWIGVALVVIACAIAGWAIYGALNGGARGGRDEI